MTLSSHLSVLRDPTCVMTFEEVSRPERAASFQAPPNDRMHFGFTRDVLWVRFVLQSVATHHKRWFIELDHTRFDWVDWFVVRRGAPVYHAQGGNLREPSFTLINRPCPAIPLTLAPGESVEVYLRVHTRAQVLIPLVVYGTRAYAEKVDRTDIVYAFSLGAFLVLFLVGLLFALFTRCRGSLIYSLSIASVALMFFGYSGFWRWLQLPGWRFGATNGLLLFNEVALIGLLQCLRRFFDLPASRPRLDRWLKVLLLISCALACWTLFDPDIPLALLVQAQDLLFGALALGIALKAFLRGDRTARFYLLAWLSAWGLLLVGCLQQWAILPQAVKPEYLSLLGLALGFILFFVAMAERVLQIRREKDAAQAQATALQQDMTARLERQVAERTESLHQAKEAAERANRYKGLFLANMSHEIRTPLCALVGLSQVMCKQSEERQLPADFTRLLEQICHGGRYLSLMLTNLLDVSAAETGKLRVHRERVRLADWNRSMRNILEPIARSRRVNLSWQDDALQGQEWDTDPVRLSQILINLVHNAVKFTPAGRGVNVRYEKSPGAFALEVADEGPGLPADSRFLFEAFEQSANAVSGSDHGVGLGLYVVQTNVRLLDGRVQARNHSGGGACFRAEWVIPA